MRLISSLLFQVNPITKGSALEIPRNSGHVSDWGRDFKDGALGYY